MPAATTTGAYRVIGNVAEADSALRLGAKVIVLTVPGDPAKAYVRGLSRGGRRVTKWIASKRLKDLRVAWEPFDKKEPWCHYETKEEAVRELLSRLVRERTAKGTGKP